MILEAILHFVPPCLISVLSHSVAGGNCVFHSVTEVLVLCASALGISGDPRYSSKATLGKGLGLGTDLGGRLFVIIRWVGSSITS